MQKTQMARQLLLRGFSKLEKKDFGGDLIKGNAREQRPISLKRPMHLVMRSTLATGARTFLDTQRKKRIAAVIARAARSHDVKVYRFANSGNHLHLIVLPRSRVAFHRFIRVISGLIARLTLGAERGNAHGKKFWDARPFTRILEWGRDYRQACDYVAQNTLEALGFIPYQPRSRDNRMRHFKA